jgi:hypothetical protein
VEHENEERFDELLFLELVKVFQAGGWGSATMVLPQPPEKPRYVVFMNGPELPPGVGTGGRYVVASIGDAEYAMGLSRRTGLDTHATSPVKGEAFHDHSFAVFKRMRIEGRKRNRKGLSSEGNKEKIDKTDWALHRVLATVELKMDNSTCKAYPVTDDLRGVAQQWLYDCAKDYGPLAKEILYVLGHVLPERAVMGLDLQPEVPLAVIAGKKASASSTARENKARWTHGNIVTPEQCGENSSSTSTGSVRTTKPDPRRRPWGPTCT